MTVRFETRVLSVPGDTALHVRHLSCEGLVDRRELI
jgi:hypothetical protein